MSVTAAKGFEAAGVATGLKSTGALDVAMVVNRGPLRSAAAVFTSNRAKANPILWSQQAVRDGVADVVVLNSGGANCFTGSFGFQTTHLTAERAEDAPAVLRKIHKKGTAAEPLRGLFETTIAGKPTVVEYEPDPDLRDTEQIPLLEEGGIEAFIKREVLPHAADAWMEPSKTRIGYEISFARYFYKPTPLRTLDQIRAEILKLEQQSEGLLHRIVGTQ